MEFPESKLAHKYCKGIGVEIGPAAHNKFNIKNCIMVSPLERIEFWNQSQVDICGEFQKIDFSGTAEELPFASDSMDYVLSSHVIEHVPNPIKAFIEWNRVLKLGGIVFMIFPKRDADERDAKRDISKLNDFIIQYKNPKPLTDEKDHIWVFTLQTMIDLITYCNTVCGMKWDIIEKLETDDKVGNGSCLIMCKS